MIVDLSQCIVDKASKVYFFMVYIVEFEFKLIVK
jgi:hypothetical protein